MQFITFKKCFNKKLKQLSEVFNMNFVEKCLNSFELKKIVGKIKFRSYEMHKVFNINLVYHIRKVFK